MTTTIAPTSTMWGTASLMLLLLFLAVTSATTEDDFDWNFGGEGGFEMMQPPVLTFNGTARMSNECPAHTLQAVIKAIDVGVNERAQELGIIAFDDNLYTEQLSWMSDQQWNMLEEHKPMQEIIDAFPTQDWMAEGGERRGRRRMSSNSLKKMCWALRKKYGTCKGNAICWMIGCPRARRRRRRRTQQQQQQQQGDRDLMMGGFDTGGVPLAEYDCKELSLAANKAKSREARLLLQAHEDQAILCSAALGSVKIVCETEEDYRR